MRFALVALLVVCPLLARGQTPDCSMVRPTIDRLTTPDHSLVAVTFQGLVDEDGDPADYEIQSITQDEPVGGLGDGDVCPDASGIDDDTAMLRAERDPNGDGRVYHIHFTADLFGDECDGVVTVCVPRDGQCGDGGELIDSVAGACPADCTPSRCDTECQLGCVGPPPDPCDQPADASTAIH